MWTAPHPNHDRADLEQSGFDTRIAADLDLAAGLDWLADLAGVTDDRTTVKQALVGGRTLGQALGIYGEAAIPLSLLSPERRGRIRVDQGAVRREATGRSLKHAPSAWPCVIRDRRHPRGRSPTRDGTIAAADPAYSRDL